MIIVDKSALEIVSSLIEACENPKRKAKFYYNVDIRKQPHIIKFFA